MTPLRAAATVAALTLAASTHAQTVKTILNNGPVNNRYDIVILGDGYQDFEEGKFDTDAQNALNKIFSKVAWSAYKPFFNAHTVFRASAESGADDPSANPPVVVNTAYDATYNFGGTQRCLYIRNTSLAHADSRLAPDVEGRVIVLVNDTQYGGCAGTFSVSYTGSQGPEVQAHEFGHSFGRLADEYDYGQSGTYSGPEPSQANITAESTGSLKWPLWLGSQGVSAFEGAGYYQFGMWRPKSDCMMRSLNVPLCPVCNEQIVKEGYVTVNPIESPVPSTTSLTATRPNTVVFAIQHIVPGNHSISWTVDGVPAGTGASVFSWSTLGVPLGQHTVTATVTDLTSLVRSDPSNLLVSSHSWTVDVITLNPGSYTVFGAGCTGSVTAPSECMSVNSTGPVIGLPAQAGATYAISATAPTALSITGMELQSSSRQTGNVSVPVAIYTDVGGAPGPAAAMGSMLIGPSTGWYSATLNTPVSLQAGETFYVSFTSPQPTPITAPNASGTPSPYFIDTGSGWTGPIMTLPWSFKLHCSNLNVAPALTANGVPELGASFDINLDQALPNTSAALFFGASKTIWNGVPLPIDLGVVGGPGCMIHASGEVIVPLPVDASGAASMTLSLPNVSALVAAQFHNQFYVADPLANQLGSAWTNGGTGVVGQ